MSSSARRAIPALLGILMALRAAPSAAADVPVRSQQFVYSVVAFNGADYSELFVREPSPVLYLLAGSDNFLSALDTFVYYWPLTNSYRLDRGALDRPFEGTLRVRGEGVDRRFSLQDFTVYAVRGEYGPLWKVAFGDEARRIYAGYAARLRLLDEEQRAYERAVRRYEVELDALTGQIVTLRSAGKDASALIAELGTFKPPRPPEPTYDYASPPTPIQRAFLLNLKRGSYRIASENPDGTVRKGSEKRLIVFGPDAARAVGYDVIPGDRWTRPASSTVPSSVLYVTGSSDLYLRPFFEARYDELAYRKLLDNDARGNPRLAMWANVRQIAHAAIVVSRRTARTTVREQAFAVEREGGAALGYRIVPWGDADRPSGALPDLVAIPLRIEPDDRVIEIAVSSPGGASLAGSAREIRVVRTPGPELYLGALVLLPLVVMAGALVARSRRLSR